jgi:ATP-dependent DNA helicase DinG
VRALGPLTALLSDVSRLTSVGRDELIWLVRRDREMEIELSLVDVGALLADSLWSNKTAVLASATIPDSLPDALGLSETAEILRLPSPFDYAQQALLYVPDNFPTRTSDNAEAAIIDELVALITAAGGRTLALFTNRTVMHRVADAVESRIDTPVLRQDTLSRARLLEKFRDDEASSLFAVTSYWQGVDVPGASLSLVTIDRLPFTRPDDPLSLARRERHGDRAFYEVDVPRAAMLLAQGWDGSIRSQSDRGVVAVLDTRLATASYRSQLLRRLPPLKRTRTRDDVVAFLAAMNDARA